MISALHCSTSAKDMSPLDLALRPPQLDLNTRHLAHLPDPSMLTARKSSPETSNIVHRSLVTTSFNGTFVDGLSRPHPTIHVRRVATLDRHDTDAWTQERKVHDTKLNAVATPTSLDSNGTVPSDSSPVGVARISSTSMEFRTQGLSNVKQLSNAVQGDDTIFRPRDWTFCGIPGSGVSALRHDATIGSRSREDPLEGRRRISEILARRGAINVSGMPPIESTAVGCCDTSHLRPVDAPVTSHVTATILVGEKDGVMITALANWTSEWVYTLVIQPYLRGSFCFQYQGKPSGSSALVASRILRVLSDVYNPVQVAIHALCFISALTGNSAYDNAPFLSVPIFRYLHNNGTFVAEDFMFRTFVTCAMIGDKTINDATLSTTTWNRLTRIPRVILSATEKYALRCLKWNVVITQTQWQDAITYLRSCIKMGSVFDPFAYDEVAPSGIMARYLDELINLGFANETTSQQATLAVEILAPQPIRHYTHWEVGTAEWCPEEDPVINQKPRTIGIAPGTNHRDGSSNVPELAHLARPAGTSFCGSFGARFAYTVKIASACQSTSWFPSHG